MTARVTRPALAVLLLQALVLALLQGLASIFPVSASGHTQSVLYLAAWDPAGPDFQLAVTLGTLAGVLLYFRRDMWFLLSAALALGETSSADQHRARRTVGLLALASIPAIAVGWWLEAPLPLAELAPDELADVAPERLVAGALVATAVALLVAEGFHRRRYARRLGHQPGDLSPRERREDEGRHEGTTSTLDAAVVGALQVLAVVPGLSRTAVTIAAGMGRGLSRSGATRLSLLLAIPMLAAVAVGHAQRLGTEVGTTAPFGGLHLAVGSLVAAGAAYGAVRALLRLVQIDDLLGFARWVIVLAVLVLFASFLVLG